MRQEYVEEKKARAEARVSPKRAISDLELPGRAVEALARGGISTVGEFLDKLAEGEEAVLALEGFGRKSLIDLKKKLRALGYQLPETGESAA
ncbi:MAG: DNA-directed RNA polymerase subunit alpha C-terminal domain-containing protein [Anaerolineales bacterium]